MIIHHKFNININIIRIYLLQTKFRKQVFWNLCCNKKRTRLVVTIRIAVILNKEITILLSIEIEIYLFP